MRPRAPYDSGETASVYDNNYRYSDIRGWLNTNFYDECLKNVDNGLITSDKVDNSALSTMDSNNLYACEDTNDRVFLLSYKDINNANYGFNSDDSRFVYASDYAKCQSVIQLSNSPVSYWWLRSPYDDYSGCGMVVGSKGRVASVNIGRANGGVRPAIRINLS